MRSVCRGSECGPPSTSYSNVAPCCPAIRHSATRGRSLALPSGRRSLQLVCSAQALQPQSYHAAYKLIHQHAAGAKPNCPQQQAQPARVEPPPDPTATAAAAAAAASTTASQEAPRRQRAQPPSERQVADGAAASPAVAEDALDAAAGHAPAAGVPAATANRPYAPHALVLPQWQAPVSNRAAALTRTITECRTYADLHKLLVENGTEFNVIHTCAWLSRVVRVSRGAHWVTPKEARLFKDGCTLLLLVLRRQLPDLHPRGYVVVAYSLCRLELFDKELLVALTAGVEAKLSVLTPQGLSTMIWALSKLGLQPPPRWMDTFLAACTGCLPDTSPRDLSLVLYSLSKLGYKAAPGRLQEFLAYALRRMDGFQSQSLTNTVYSLAYLQQHPGTEWLAAAQAQAVRLGARAFTPQGMTQLSWGLARLGAAPSDAFLELVQSHLSMRLYGTHIVAVSKQRSAVVEGEGRRIRIQPYHGLDYVTLMYALAIWQRPPPPALSRRLLAALLYEIPSLQPNQLSNALWACAKLRLYPTHSWFSSWLDASYLRLSMFKPGDLAQTLWALARLGARPPAQWLGAALRRVEVTAGDFSPTEISNTLWAMARLRRAASPEVLAHFFMATDRRLSGFKPKELSAMAWALARMRGRPDKEWTAEFLKASYHKASTMGGWSLATMAWSLAEMGLAPPPAWMYNFVNAARAQLQDLSALDLGNLVLALRRLNGPAALSKVDDFVIDALDRLSGMEVADRAYSTQQVSAFLAMNRYQAGLPLARSGDASEEEEEEEEGGLAEGVPFVDDEDEHSGSASSDDADESGDGMAVAAAVDEQLGLELQQQLQQLAASVRHERQRQGAAAKGSQPPPPPPVSPLPLSAPSQAHQSHTPQRRRRQQQQPLPARALDALHPTPQQQPRITIHVPAEIHLELGELDLGIGPAAGAPATSIASSGGGGRGPLTLTVVPGAAGQGQLQVETGPPAAAADGGPRDPDYADIKRRVMAAV